MTYSVTLVSVIRLNYLLKGNLQDPDITWNFVDIGLWSVIEGNIAMVCGKCHVTTSVSIQLNATTACLPFLRPILNKLTFGIFNISSVGSKPHHSSNFIKVSHNNASSHRWDDIGRSGRTSATVKAKGDAESDESPFVVAASDKGPQRSVSSVKDERTSIELGTVPPRQNSLGDGIMVTREITMKHQSLGKVSDMC